MSIDWFTFVAQIINFLILVGLLRGLLYRPILAAMLAREQQITDRWQGAEQKLAQANELMELYQNKQADFDLERDQQLQEIHRHATELSDQLTRQTREQVEAKRTQWLIMLEKEQSESADQLRQQIGELAVHSTTHLLNELASVKLETLIVAKFLATIENLSNDQRDEIRALMLETDGDILIRSAFVLDQAVRNQISDRLHTVFDVHRDIRYETAQALICGIQLDANGYSIEWNADDLIGDIQLDFAARATPFREVLQEHE